MKGGRKEGREGGESITTNQIETTYLMTPGAGKPHPPVAVLSEVAKTTEVFLPSDPCRTVTVNVMEPLSSDAM